LNKKYEYLFPQIEKERPVLERRKITRKKLNDIILPLAD